MPQLYCQLASRPSPWLLGRTSAGLCTLQTACPLTVTYSGGSPATDTIAAGSAATVYGGSAAAFDASADVWVVLTVPASGALRVVKEADLATVVGDWAGLARVVQHSTEPYQPQAYLATGSPGSLPSAPATTTDASTVGADKVDAVGTAGGTPLTTEPAGWTTPAFDDSAWGASSDGFLVAYSAVDPLGPSGAHWVGVTAYTGDQPGPGGQQWLLRHHFTLGSGAVSAAQVEIAPDDRVLGAYVNGTLVGGPSPGPSGFGTIYTYTILPSLLVLGGSNVLALEVINGASGAPGATRTQFVLSVTQSTSTAGAHEGDLLYYHSGAWTDLPIGPSGDLLTSDGTDPGWAAPATHGTVTSVAIAGPTGTTASGSPVTSSGTLTLSWSSQSANTFLGAPNGSSGAPTFRALVAGDIPSLPASQITSGQLATARGGTGLDGSAAANGALLIGNGSGYSLATLTAGSGVTITNASGTVTIASSGGGSGTVTSVALTLPGFLSVSGSPITTSGTLAVTLANENAATVFAGPSSGSAAAPTFRALQGSDLPAAASAGGHLHAHGHFL